MKETFVKLKDGRCSCKGSLFYSEYSVANQGFSVVLKNLMQTPRRWSYFAEMLREKKAKQYFLPINIVGSQEN